MKSGNALEKMMKLECSTSTHHYYLTGTSASGLEELGLKMVSFIEKKQAAVFKGIVKHFSIIMPYFDSQQEALKFLAALQENISIARNCYEEFAGIILIECDKDWSRYGANRAMQTVLEGMRQQKKVRYIVLMPETGKPEQSLYSAFSLIGVWAFMEIEALNTQDYAKLCDQKIREAGMYITEPAREELYSALEIRRKELADNESILTQWLSQVVINHKLLDSDSREITIADVRMLPGICSRKKEIAMGFIQQKGE